MKEEDNKVVMFMMSMSDTMRFLIPAPIEMDPTDKFRADEERKSRWALCCELIRLMVKQMSGLPIDVLLAKNTDTAVSVTRGNAKDCIHPIINLLQSLSAQTRSNGMCDPELAVREFDRLMASSEYKRKSIHWFVDAETFLVFDPSIISNRFDTLTIHVIGELRTIHDDYETAKRASTIWTQQLGSRVRLLLCGADFDDFKEEILADKKYELREKTIPCKFGRDFFQIKLHGKREFGSPDWPCDSVKIVGFLPEIELCRLSVLAQKCHAEDVYEVSAKSETGNEILWSIASAMLADAKQGMTCLCNCMTGSGQLEYGLLVADLNEGQVGLSLLRLRNLPTDEFLTLKAVSSVGETSEELPDDSDPVFAPMDHRVIKRRLSDISETSEGPSAKRSKFESFRDEYQVMEAGDKFNEFTADWQKEHL